MAGRGDNRVSIASSSANTSGRDACHRAGVSDQQSLNRFFVSEYFRTNPASRSASVNVSSQSLLRQRILPDGALGIGEYLQKTIVSIASSSANTSGLYANGKEVVRYLSSQSLLRQRILPDGKNQGGKAESCEGKSQSLLRQRILPDPSVTYLPSSGAG